MIPRLAERIDMNDRGAEVREDHGHGRPGDVLAEADDLDAIEG